MLGQLFNKETQAIFFNYKEKPVQRMLDFDFVCGRLSLARALEMFGRTRNFGRARAIWRFTGRAQGARLHLSLLW